MTRSRHTWRSSAVALLRVAALAFGVEALIDMTNALAAEAECVGDCNADHTVTVDEVITMVDAALDSRKLSKCPSGVVNGDGEITINELITAVDHAAAR